jgi:hypothetical protein
LLDDAVASLLPTVGAPVQVPLSRT